MQPGEYKISCEAAKDAPWKDGWQTELKHRVIDGPHTGTALRQWITFDATGVLSPRSRYIQQCEIALGRPVDADDNLDDPASIFTGKIFRADVGFRKTEKPGGGRSADPLKRKDAKDGLRVHELLALEGL